MIESAAQAGNSAIASVRPSDFVLSPDGLRLYTSGADGFVRVYNAETGEPIASWEVGINLGGIDLSPDGSFLIVVERHPLGTNGLHGWDREMTIASYKVDTTTGAATTLPFTATGYDHVFYDVGILADGSAVFSQGWSGSGHTSLKSLNTGTGVYTDLNYTYYQNASLTVSPDRSRLMIGELNLSAANLDIYRPGLGITASHGTYENDVYGYASGIEAYNLEGSFAAHFTGGRIHVYDAALQYRLDLTDLHPGLNDAAGLAFNADGSSLYVLDASTDSIVELSTANWAILGSIPIGGNASFGSGQSNELIVGPDERYFLAITDTGLRRVDNPAVADALVGTPGADVVTGTGGDDTLIGDSGADTTVGGAGDDKHYVDNAGDIVVEGVGEGRDTVIATRSHSLAADAEVEVLKTADRHGTGAIDLGGNGLAQEIFGNNGRNVLRGGGGEDVLTGFGGDDIYHVDDPAARIVEAANGGRDTVYASIGYALGAGAHVEILSAAALGGTDPLHLSGNELSNEIYGNAGANVLRGGGGADLLLGGLGDDIYYVAGGGEAIFEYAGQGRDTVYTGVNHALAAGSHVEILSAISLSGTEPLQLSGNALAQEIYGNAGANVLRGGGGADLMLGGLGNDIYYVASGNETIFEYGGEGLDIVYAGLNHALAAGSHVEVLSAISLSGTAPLQLSGNELNNEIYGNAGANVLRGGGGSDLLLGGFGDDIYYVTSGAETIFEYGGQGRDIVYTSLSHTLAAGSHVEILSAISLSGTDALNFGGNALNNEIYGNAGANIFYGGGGADTLVGGFGDDIYYIVGGGELLYEGAGQGRDVAYADLSYTLTGGAQIEILSAASVGGTGAINLTGNAFGQEVGGNDGANTLDGKGGNDVLIGHGGADSFAFTSALGAGNVDTLADFLSGTDRIALDDAVFTGMGLGALSSGAFVAGGGAADADDRIIYDAASGRILFDADGSGAGAAVQFASVAVGTVLVASDFVVI